MKTRMKIQDNRRKPEGLILIYIWLTGFFTGALMAYPILEWVL